MLPTNLNLEKRAQTPRGSLLSRETALSQHGRLPAEHHEPLDSFLWEVPAHVVSQLEWILQAERLVQLETVWLLEEGGCGDAVREAGRHGGLGQDFPQ